MTLRDLHGNVVITTDPILIGNVLRAMFGPWAVPPTPPEIARWQDDGGPPLPGEDGYTHTIEPAR